MRTLRVVAEAAEPVDQNVTVEREMSAIEALGLGCPRFGLCIRCRRQPLHPLWWAPGRDTVGGMVRRTGTRPGWGVRSLVVLLTIALVGFCLTVGASLGHAERACPGSEVSVARVCALPEMLDPALVVVAPVLPVTARPGLAVSLPVTLAQPLGRSHHPDASPPRAPPGLL
jgi:hypothetical protein